MIYFISAGKNVYFADVGVFSVFAFSNVFIWVCMHGYACVWKPEEELELQTRCEPLDMGAKKQTQVQTNSGPLEEKKVL